MSVLNFGKYKGETIQSVLKLDPAWIVWCYNNVKSISHTITSRQYQRAQKLVKEKKQVNAPIKHFVNTQRKDTPQRHKTAFEMDLDYEKAYRATHRSWDGKLIGSDY